jgi:2-oxoglutarate ferredoxin oxidoreductase subunit delta
VRSISIDESSCDGCGVCVFMCPHGVYQLRSNLNKRGVTPAEAVRAEACDGCRYCDRGCPFFKVCSPPQRFGVCAGAGRCELACPQLAIRVEPYDERTDAVA